MPHRTALIGELDLVEIDRDGPIPAFVGRINDRRLIIRFDTAALARLAGKIGAGDAVSRALRDAAPAIRGAAQTLLKGGFWTETEEGIELLVTALDI